MTAAFYELTDAGKRRLLRQLAVELSADKIAELVEPYSSRLCIDHDDGAPYITFSKSELDMPIENQVWVMYMEDYEIEKIIYENNIGDK